VWFYRSIEPLAPARLQDYRSGDLLARLISDIETLEIFYVRAVIPPLAAALVTGLACALLGSFDFRLGLVLLVFLVVTGIVLPLANRYLCRQPAQDMVSARAELNAGLVDQIQGLADLLANNQETTQLDWLARSNRILVQLQERLAWIRGGGDALAAFITGLAALVILFLAIPLVTGGEIDGVYLALLPLAAIASFEAVQPLANAMGQTEASLKSAQRLFDIIDSLPPVPDPLHPVPLPVEPDLIVQDLSFRYTQDEPYVLEKVSFNLPVGGRLAIVGSSGAGKSSLVNLLLRFWDYNEGSLRLGNQDLCTLAAAEVRELFSVVPQHTHLFNVTIRDNLLLGNPDASDAQILAACRTAQIYDFILTLPQGYDTLIGENGYLLSGGQRQRLAIARALLKSAAILLLDEPTANLDPITERILLRSILESHQFQSILVITHRLVGLENMDEILVLEAGKIVQRGVHKSLIEQDGLYRQMWLTQNQLIFETGATA
jgi:thiol reductant ABC exporter CydC subunit